MNALLTTLTLLILLGSLTIARVRLSHSELATAYLILEHAEAQREAENLYQDDYFQLKKLSRLSSLPNRKSKPPTQRGTTEEKAPRKREISQTPSKLNLAPLFSGANRGSKEFCLQVLAYLCEQLYGQSHRQLLLKVEQRLSGQPTHAEQPGQAVLDSPEEQQLRKKLLTGEPSLLDYVTLEPTMRKINVACAPRPLLSAIYGAKADQVDQLRQNLRSSFDGTKVEEAVLAAAQGKLREQALTLLDPKIVNQLDFSFCYRPQTIAVRAGKQVRVQKRRRAIITGYEGGSSGGDLLS